MLGGYGLGWNEQESESIPRALTRDQVLENRAFLKVLRRTANVRLACRELGLKYGTMQHRRRAHPGFAAAVGATGAERGTATVLTVAACHLPNRQEGASRE